VSTGPTPYAPFPIIGDPAAFALQETLTPTRFGPMYTLFSPEPTSDTVTLFLHGVGGDWSTWTPLLKQAANEGVAIRDHLLVDIPGFGRSPNTQKHLRAAVVGKAILDAANEHGWPKVRIIGHSMGGFLALDMATRWPDRIESVAVVSGTYLTIVDTYQHPFRSLRTSPRTAAVFTLMRLLALLGPLGAALVRATSRTRIFRAVAGAALAHPERVDPSVLQRIADGIRPASFIKAAANAEGYDPIVQWSKIPADLPVTALYGAADHLVPPGDRDRVVAELPAVETHMLGEAGHFAHVEQPRLCLQLLRAHL
jgi:pimeloyl-ACP methyl ester carboxylesterase